MVPLTPHTQARFLPGAMIAGRYRVVALLGRGGMGEVYRADDTKLGEAVALKFLPERLENDVSLRERFLGEARLARAVAHPNVCRVYDVGEVSGRLFLSMEYVDGEDLATLLRRIGRLPEDKAVQIAHEICAGLQAAHEQGIVHRDLKPSNIMLDGRGRARITDFGLAALASAVSPDDVAAGTPAYMAPEQLAGQEVTVRSDVYALGLVLYELFTGRAAFEAAGWAEQLHAKQSTTPSAPSLITPGLDPAVERVVLRCLNAEPGQRPASASAVALALPGGDPLAAALAAGETPSPEMVAEAGGDDVFPAGQTWGWLAAVLAALLAMFVLAPRLYLIQQVPIEKPPAVLTDRARDIAQALGWSTPPGDESTIMLYDGDHGAAVAKQFGRAAVVEHLRRYPAGTFTLLYRRSPLPLLPQNFSTLVPTASDPPLTVPGMLSIRVDPAGRLYSFEACPPDLDTLASAAAPVAWGRIFALAGLDTARFQRVASRWSPRMFADERVAWLGSVPGDSTLSLRIEAAAFHGQPVAFRRMYAWTTPANTTWSGKGNVLGWIVWIVFLGLLLLAGYVARNNLRAGRADARGALRLAVAAGLLILVRLWLGVHVAAEPQWLFVRLLRTIGYGALFSLIVCVLYLTLEPVVRRTWPRILVSWVRLLDGRWRDRRVGRDMLVGIAAGVLLLLVDIALSQAWTRITGKPLSAELIDSPSTQTDALMGTAAAASILLTALAGALQSALTGAALMALFTVFTRRNVLAVVLAGASMILLGGPGGASGAVGYVLLVVTIAVMMLLMVRYGFLALLVALTTSSVLAMLPLAAPGSGWYWPTTAVGLVALLGLAAWSVRAMRLGSPAPQRPAMTRLPGRTLAAATAGTARVAPAPAASARVQDLSQAPTEFSPRPQDLSQAATQFTPRPPTGTPPSAPGDHPES